MVRAQITSLILITIMVFLEGFKGFQKETDGNGGTLLVLGIAQDAGYPQIACEKKCCNAYWEGKKPGEMVCCIALFSEKKDKYWLFDATPDIKEQLKLCNEYLGGNNFKLPEGILLTHAHIGHYTGLMELGKEALDAQGIPVFVMPRMKKFLTGSGPWDQLVKRKNIELIEITENQKITLDSNFSVVPLLVPHRDEYSETVGFQILGPEEKALFIPDIDKWEKWENSISTWIKDSRWAFLDGTFYSSEELPGRDISEIPHPTIIESMEQFKGLEEDQKRRVQFIHFNHTNPLIFKESKETKAVEGSGFGIAREGKTYPLL